MIAIFRDEISPISYTDVAQIVPTGKNEWSLMFTDFSERTVKGELVEITMEGF